MTRELSLIALALVALAWAVSLIPANAAAQPAEDGVADPASDVPVSPALTAETAPSADAEPAAEPAEDEGEDEADEDAADEDAEPVRYGPVIADEDDEDYATLPEVEDPWVLQLAARMGTGFGVALGDNNREFLLDSSLRVEFMFQRRGDEHFQLGPALELRAADFATLDLAAGFAVGIPVARGYPIFVSLAAGYSFRRHGKFGGNAPILVATLAGGYRSFNFHHWFQTSLQLYAQVRMDIDDPGRLQMMFGIEIDLGQAVVVPALMIRMKVRGGDPDEMDEDEEEEEEQAVGTRGTVFW